MQSSATKKLLRGIYFDVKLLPKNEIDSHGRDVTGFEKVIRE